MWTSFVLAWYFETIFMLPYWRAGISPCRNLVYMLSPLSKEVGVLGSSHWGYGVLRTQAYDPLP